MAVDLKFFDLFGRAPDLIYLFLKELCALMFALDWIKAKTEFAGPAHLIHEFLEYRHILDEKVCINMGKKSLKDMLFDIKFWV